MSGFLYTQYDTFLFPKAKLAKRENEVSREDKETREELAILVCPVILALRVSRETKDFVVTLV